MISRILVPLDGSKVAQKAAKYAVDLAKQTGASLVLLSVVDNTFFIGQAVSAVASPTHLKESVADYLKQSAEAATDVIIKYCARNRVPCKAAVKTGRTVEEIIREAKRSRADLIVMGSRGKSALTAAVLGSATYGVLHKEMNIPVLIVKR